MPSMPVPSRWDRSALWLAIVLGVAAAAWTVVQAVLRVVEIAPNRDGRVAAAFAETAATMPVGPGGTEVEVGAAQVVLRVSDMPPVTLWSLILAEVVNALAVVAIIALVCLVIRNIIGWRAFSAGTVGYVGAATVVAAVGWVLGWLFSTMGANGGAAALAGEPGVNTPFTIEPIVVFAIASLGALAAAFQIGHKLQRDQEGLV
ncbi:MAG: hypothetical protein ACTHMQ_01445 [Protaetiibacter sp.]